MAMAFVPPSWVKDEPPSSGGLVIRNILRRSKGAVHVRDTKESLNECDSDDWPADRTCTSNTSRKQEPESSAASQPLVMILLFVAQVMPISFFIFVVIMV